MYIELAILPFGIVFSSADFSPPPLSGSSVPQAARYASADALSAPAAPRWRMCLRVSGSRSRRSNWRSRSSLLGVIVAVSLSHDVDVLVRPAQAGRVSRRRQVPAG